MVALTRLNTFAALLITSSLVAAFWVPGPAGAETQNVSASGEGVIGVTLTGAEISNGRRGVTVVAELAGLTSHSADDGLQVVATLNLSPIGSCDSDLPSATCNQRLNYYVSSAPLFHSVELDRLADEDNGRISYRAVRCQSLRESWEPDVDQVTLFVPHSCLGRDAGQAKVQVDLAWEGGSFGSAVSRRLHRGDPGARPLDINGDARRDSVTYRPRHKKYRVTVDLGKRKVHAQAPLPRVLRGQKPDLDGIRSADLNRDGRAEVLIPIAFRTGHSEYHVFTLVKRNLRLVKVRRRPFVLRSGGDQHHVVRNFACTGNRVTTWDFLEANRDDTIYTVSSRSFRLKGARAIGSPTRKIKEQATTLTMGNWSIWGCLL